MFLHYLLWFKYISAVSEFITQCQKALLVVNSLGARLTARYCGVSVPRPARFPQVEALLSCCIWCTSCCCRRRCSLSLCVSANFTTRGEEQPWSTGQRFYIASERNAEEFKVSLNRWTETATVRIVKNI